MNLHPFKAFANFFFFNATATTEIYTLSLHDALPICIRSTDLVVCSGSELEIGWIPLLLTQSGNNRIQRASSGFVEASQFVVKLEIPKVIDRALGDIHPAGNPHVHLDPRNIARVAEVLTGRLA